MSLRIHRRTNSREKAQRTQKRRRRKISRKGAKVTANGHELIRLRKAYGATGSETKTNRRWTRIYADKKRLVLDGDLRDRSAELRTFGELSRAVEAFVLQREGFKHFDEDSRPRGDKIIHNKVAKPRRENISQQGHKGRKDRPFEFLKSVFVAFAILL